uniref:Uncharacterized protein n=1 Tax=Timema cristinae TaxID=61476 RepID=A0A7R9H6T5_TIMCR|nr:unnamed protein product [Timema cristinae]
MAHPGLDLVLACWPSCYNLAEFLLLRIYGRSMVTDLYHPDLTKPVHNPPQLIQSLRIANFVTSVVFLQTPVLRLLCSILLLLGMLGEDGMLRVPWLFLELLETHRLFVLATSSWFILAWYYHVTVPQSAVLLFVLVLACKPNF